MTRGEIHALLCRLRPLFQSQPVQFGDELGLLTIEVEVLVKSRLPNACDKNHKAEAIAKTCHTNEQTNRDVVFGQFRHVWKKARLNPEISLETIGVDQGLHASDSDHA